MKNILFIILCLLCGSSGAADLREFNSTTYYATKEEAMQAAGTDVYDTERNKGFNSFIMSNNDRVIRYLGSSYAGEWTEYGVDGKLYQVIAITDPITVDRIIFAHDYYKFIYMKYNYGQLEEVKNRIDGIFKQPGGGASGILINMVAIDPRLNKVNVFVSSKNQFLVYDELRRIGLNLEMINIEIQDQMHRPVLNYFPGTKLINKGAGQQANCTGGFVGNIDIYHVLLTAGHCFPVGISQVYFDSGYGTSGVFIGNLMTSVYGGLYGMDYATFSNANFAHTIYAGILVPPSTMKSVKPPVQPLVGQRVCSYGAVTGWRCADIIAVNATVPTSDGVTLYNFAVAKFCSIKGDSGGPVVLEVGDNAVGMVATSNCGGFGGANATSSFQPIIPVINAINNFNLWTN